MKAISPLTAKMNIVLSNLNTWWWSVSVHTWAVLLPIAQR